MTAPDGRRDIAAAALSLGSRLPEPLRPLAELAYNYRWSWLDDGPALFTDLDPERWELVANNPVRLLQEVTPERLAEAAADPRMVRRTTDLARRFRDDLDRPYDTSVATSARPVAFLCAEFGIHRSFAIYSGGLGILAGDILKESADQALPLVGVGLLYRQGYFQQRIDQSGQQHEYWIAADPERLPAALVTGDDGAPLTVTVPVRGHDVTVQWWRVNVGKVTLYLLDAERPENQHLDRWITGRLYVGDRAIRLAQYALLGVGSIRALRMMGMDPSAIHLNEGHAALAPLELARQLIREGAGVDEALDQARARTIFTTHTPVAAGNEGYSTGEIEHVLGDFPAEVGIEPERFLRMGRSWPDNPDEPFGMTQLGLRISRSANGVSRRHGEVARGMWQPLFPDLGEDDVPIGHVTNGVHVPTWMAAPMRTLLDRHLGEGWWRRAADPATWEPVDDIPDAEVWGVRQQLRRDFITGVRDRIVSERLARYEPPDYVEAAVGGFEPDTLTLGFARRVATYKRLHLLTLDISRAGRVFEGERPVQLILAGKAHPQDNDGKDVVRNFFTFKTGDQLSRRVAYLDNYDMGVAASLVAGCDVWVNVPRPPLEASGTSGMKSAMNGGLNLSILDGWWCEGYNGENGWGIPGEAAVDHQLQDMRDSDAFYGLVEREVVPLFYDRDEQGVPRGWVRRIKASLRTVGPQFSATRMVRDYLRTVYAAPPRG